MNGVPGMSNNDFFTVAYKILSYLKFESVNNFVYF